MSQQYVEVVIGPGLHGVTKLRWRDWPTRNWLSWVIAGCFLAIAVMIIVVATETATGEAQWQAVVRWAFTAGLVLLVATRLTLEGTVSKPVPGQPPKWDRQLVDPWWTTIHTLTGVVLGLWLTPFIIIAAATLLWEVLEICVPGFGDEEINGNRLTDILVAWTGWLVAAGIFALASQVPLPLV